MASRKIIQERVEAIKPREWQVKALYSFGDCKNRLFIATVCPGAGKTMLGCLISAQKILGANFIVICLVPTLPIKNDWVKTASNLGIIASGDCGNYTEDVDFRVATYASAKHTLNNIPPGRKVLLICDEFHHAERDAAWGDGLNYVAQVAEKIVMLSGTPWRTQGEIALLKDRYDDKGMIKADYSYKYEDDLQSPTRGTLPVVFELLHAVAYKTIDGVRTNISEYVPPVTEDDWNNVTEENIDDANLGKHIDCSNVYKNETAQNILAKVVSRLDESRGKHCNFAMGLVVARSIPEANNIGEFIRRTYGLNVEVIHSKNDTSEAAAADRIAEIKKQLENHNPRVPDVIVSVGMISEGVDIPALSVLGFLTPICTTLYLYQLIFRVLRRTKKYYSDRGIKIDPPAYYDDSISYNKVGYVIAPAHPKIVNLAKEIKKIVADALKARDAEQQRERLENGNIQQPAEYEQESNGDIAQAIDGQTIESGLNELIKRLSMCEYVLDRFFDLDGFNAWWQAQLQDKPQLIERLNAIKNQCIDQYNAVIESISTSNPVLINYDDEQRACKEETKKIIRIIRHSSFMSSKGIPFKDIPDEDVYPLIRGLINKRSRFNLKENATLGKRKTWNEEALKLYQELRDGHN